MFDLTYFRVEVEQAVGLLHRDLEAACAGTDAAGDSVGTVTEASKNRVVVHLGDREQSPIRLDVFRRRHKRSL